MHFRRGIKLATAVASIAGGLLLNCCGKSPSAKAAAPATPPEVSVVVIQPQRAALITELPGRISAYQIAEVRPQVGGIIQKRLFTEGSDVKAGQVLYQIDPATYRATFASAKAAEARAEANLIPARLKEQRYRDLVKIKAVSQQDYDDASATLKQSEADVAAAKATVETARINLAYTRLTAPISGRISRSTVTTGALVTASQATQLATIQQIGSVYVDVTQSSAEMLRLKQDLASGDIRKNSTSQAKVKLLLEDGTPYPLTGTLKFSEVTVDQSTGSVTMRMVFSNPKQALLPGMFVRAILEEGANENAILVPQRGVTRNQKGDATVMLVGAGENVEPRPIKVLRTIGDNWLVSEGIKAGDRVIVEGLQKARPGTPVKAVPFGSAPTTPQTGTSQPTAVKK